MRVVPHRERMGEEVKGWVQECLSGGRGGGKVPVGGGRRKSPGNMEKAETPGSGY